MEIRKSNYTEDKTSIRFVDLLGNEGNYFFDKNRFTADKAYKMDVKYIDEPESVIDLKLNSEMYEIEMDKDITITVQDNYLQHGDSTIFILKQDSIGGHMPTFDPNFFLFPSGNLPNFSLHPNGIDMIGCIVMKDGRMLCDATLDFM